jgi:hypothetical protein
MVACYRSVHSTFPWLCLSTCCCYFVAAGENVVIRVTVREIRACQLNRLYRTIVLRPVYTRRKPLEHCLERYGYERKLCDMLCVLIVDNLDKCLSLGDRFLCLIDPCCAVMVPRHWDEPFERLSLRWCVHEERCWRISCVYWPLLDNHSGKQIFSIYN